jgi:hypothetical protein
LSRPQSALAYVLTGLIAIAMGLQNGAFSRIGPLSVRTTHVTGISRKLTAGGSISTTVQSAAPWLPSEASRASLPRPLPVRVTRGAGAESALNARTRPVRWPSGGGVAGSVDYGFSAAKRDRLGPHG